MVRRPRLLLAGGLLVAGAMAGLGAVRDPAPAPTVLLLGDSLTYGQTGPGTSLPGGFRDPLHALLEADDVPHLFTGSRRDNGTIALLEAGQDAHEGWPGYRVDQASLLLPEAPPDAAVVLLGTNDLAQRHEAAPTAARLAALLDQLEATSVVVVAPPPYLRDPSAVVPDPASTQYDAAVRQVVAEAAADGRRVVLADGWAPFVQEGPGRDVVVDRSLVGPDGTHLTETGYRLLAEAVAPVLRELLVD